MASIFAIFMPLTYVQGHLIFNLMVFCPASVSLVRLLASFFIYKYDTPADCKKKGIDVILNLNS